AQLRLKLDRGDFTRRAERSDYQRYDTASRAQLEHAVARGHSEEARQQHRIDREAIATARLNHLDSPAQDRIHCRGTRFVCSPLSQAWKSVTFPSATLRRERQYARKTARAPPDQDRAILSASNALPTPR